MSRALTWLLAQNDYKLRMIIGCKIWLTVRTLIAFTLKVVKTWDYPAGNYMFKVNNRNTRARCEKCSKLTIKTPERRRIWDPFKYLWWNVFGKLPISGFNPLIVPGTFQRASSSLLWLVPRCSIFHKQRRHKFTINQLYVDFITKDWKRHYKLGQLKVG